MKNIQLNNWFDKSLPLLKTYTKGYIRSNGRNNTGKITCYHKGGGHKRSYRLIQMSRQSQSLIINGIITSVEYDPNRSCFIASIFDYNKHYFTYMLAYADCEIGDIVKSGTNAELYIGHVLKLADIPEGACICNVAENKSKIKKYSRAGGTYAVLSEKTKTYCVITLPSSKKKKVSPESSATIGSVSKEQMLIPNKKAGHSRWLNIRPTVRGVAMNPVDHPHGGGEGKKSGHKYTPWGKQKHQKRKKSIIYHG